MILPFVFDHKYANKNKMLEIYNNYPLYNLVPANFLKWEDNHSNNYNFHHVFASNPYNYGFSTKKSNADYPFYTTRRLVANSCSDSSVDGRSSDSNYTSSGGSAVSNDVPGKGGGGGGGADCGDGISGRFTRQAVNSRFPSMNMNTTYRVHKPPTYYPGMGAYAHLQQQQYNMNSTYPKVNYSLTSQAYHHPQLANRRKSQNHYSIQHHQQQQQQSPPYYYINNNINRAQHFNHHNANNNSSITNSTHKSNCGNQETFKMSENLQHKDLNNCNDNLDGTYTISPGGTKQPNQPQSSTATNGRRFVNVDKILMQSNKSSQTSNGTVKEIQENENEAKKEEPEKQSNKTPTPSVKSSTYSQKSTASAQSSNSTRSIKEDTPEKKIANQQNDDNDENPKPAQETTEIVSTPLTTVEGTVTEAAEIAEVTSESPTKWRTGEEVLQLEDVVDSNNVVEEIEEKEEKLERNGSLASLQSKTESIKTQLEDTPPVLSRTQSAKSLVIEEDIEDNTSFVVVEDVVDDNDINIENLTNIIEDPKAQGDAVQCCSKPSTAKSRSAASRAQSPTIEEIKALSRRNSLAKSMESLYERPPSKHEYIDNTTETSSQSSAQLNSSTGSSSVPLKSLHTPLKQKSKTTHFLKSHRRISPVKQSIKMVQAELYPATLQRFEKPREALMKTFDQLDSSNWEVVMMGLKNMVRLMRYHPENLDPQMHMICIQLTRSVRNLRSQVARAACTAATELFTIKSRYLEQECDDLVCALLHRTADTNRFIRADATRALESMCDNLTPGKILNILTNKGALHPNALVRTTTAKLLNRLVERLGCDKIYTMPRDQRDKFFVTGANLLLEGSLETRSYAKSLFKLLSSHPQYPRLLLEIIPPRTYRNIEKTLKSIR